MGHCFLNYFLSIRQIWSPIEVTFCLKVKDDFSWTLHFHGKFISIERDVPRLKKYQVVQIPVRA